MPEFLSLLVFAALFYLMMRFGCGAHMIHGHAGHGSHEGHGIPDGNTKDPVCGMDVAAGGGYCKMLEGRQYRFCSRKCFDQFDAEPQRYVGKAGGMS